MNEAPLWEQWPIRVKRCGEGATIYNVNDEYIGRSLDTYGEISREEVDLYRQILQPSMTALEVGANIGVHTIPLARCVGPGGRVVAFEPQRIVFQMLCANVALNALTDTVDTLNPMIKYLGPYVTVCGAWTSFWTFFSDHVSEQTSLGSAQRAMLNFANHQPNNVGQQGAPHPAEGYPAGTPPQATSDAEFLHGPAYSPAIDSNGNADCETGQRGYVKNLNYFGTHNGQHFPGLETDQYTPGNQGPTYWGRTHVPAGETFSRIPLTGPQTPFNPINH